jgi:hypothetical protein
LSSSISAFHALQAAGLRDVAGGGTSFMLQPSLMSSNRVWPTLRIVFVFIAIIVIYSNWPKDIAEFSMSNSSILSKLEISLKGTSTAPPKLALSVKNNNDVTVTLLAWDSPLDTLAIRLGVLKFTPSGADGPLDLPTIMVNRRMPPSRDALITLGPGEVKEQEFELKEPMVPVEKLKGQVNIEISGEWRAVWELKADEVSDEELVALGGEKAAKGPFEVKSVSIDF